MSARIRRSQEQTRIERERVLSTALAIASRVGYDSTRMAEVAKEAQQSESFVYWHFQNKETLLSQAMEFGYLQRRRRGQTWQDPTPGSGRLDALIKNFAGPEGTSTTEHEPWRLGLILSLEGRDSDAQKTFVRMRAETQERLHAWWSASLSADVADRDRAAGLLTHLSLAGHDGHFLARSARGASERTHVLLAHAIESVAKGLEAGAPIPDSGAQSAVQRRPVAEATSVKQSLLNAAMAEVLDRGPASASVARICEVAGTPPTSLYWWFDDRSTLIAAAIKEIHNRWRQVAFRFETDSSSTLDELFDAFASAQLSATNEVPDMPRLLVMEALHHDTETAEAHAELSAFRLSAHMSLAAAIFAHSGQRNADEIASFTLSVADGLFIAACVDHRFMALERMAPLLSGMASAAARVS